MVGDQVEPFAVADALSCIGSHRIGTVFLKPFVGIEEEMLLAPQHARQCLPHHIRRIVTDPGRRDRPVKFVGLAATLVEALLEFRTKWLTRNGIGQPQPDRGGLPAVNRDPIMRRGLRACLVRIDGLLPTRHDVVVDSVLDIG